MRKGVRVYVCTGKHCRRRNEKLLAELEAAEWAEVEPVKCQSICEGPVAGVQVQGALEWFERVRGPKRRAALRTLHDTGELEGTLEKRRVGKQRNRLKR